MTVHVDLTANPSPLEEAMRKASRGMRAAERSLRKASRAVARLADTSGDRHIERVMREILAAVPGRDPAVRLLAASDLAQVLDGGTR